MQLDVYYMFVPTPSLANAAQSTGMNWLLEPDLWMDTESDRAGLAHTQGQVEQAFWSVFLAKLVGEPPEPKPTVKFRQRCLELGFSGCWTVHVARGGESVDELLREAEETASLARDAQGA
jgi:hypothetical protein